MEAVALHRVGFLAYSCPKQGQDFKPSAAPLYPNTGQVPPPPPWEEQQVVAYEITSYWSQMFQMSFLKAFTLLYSKSQHFTCLSSPQENKYGCLELTANPRTVLT